MELPSRFISMGQMLTCNLCGLLVDSPTRLEFHYRTQHGSSTVGGGSPAMESRFSCEQCDKTFTVLSNLKRHIKTIHEKEKAYSCEVCNKSFSQHGNMKRHMKVHRDSMSDSSVLGMDNEYLVPGNMTLSTINSYEVMSSEELEQCQDDVIMDEVTNDYSMLSVNVAEDGLAREPSAGTLVPTEFLNETVQTYANPSAAAPHSQPYEVGRIPSLERAGSSSGGIAFDHDQMMLVAENSQGMLPVPVRMNSGLPTLQRITSSDVMMRITSASSEVGAPVVRQWSSDYAETMVSPYVSNTHY